MEENNNHPFVFDIQHSKSITLSNYDNHIVRNLSAMKGQYLNSKAFQSMLLKKDIILYEVYENVRPSVSGELLHGLSIVHPGKIGNEYFMTKGHFHSVLETAEIYICLRGEGYMIMETPEGKCVVEKLLPNKVLYVPPRWAHRSVNTSTVESLVTFFVYPGNAGHDYGSIENQGFKKLIIEKAGKPAIVDNPRWLTPQERA